MPPNNLPTTNNSQPTTERNLQQQTYPQVSFSSQSTSTPPPAPIVPIKKGRNLRLSISILILALIIGGLIYIYKLGLVAQPEEEIGLSEQEEMLLMNANAELDFPTGTSVVAPATIADIPLSVTRVIPKDAQSLELNKASYDGGKSGFIINFSIQGSLSSYQTLLRFRNNLKPVGWNVVSSQYTDNVALIEAENIDTMMRIRIGQDPSVPEVLNFLITISQR